MDFEPDLHADTARARARELGSRFAQSAIERDREGRWTLEPFLALGSAGLLAGGSASGLLERSEVASPLVLSEALIGFGEGSGDAGLAHAWVAHTIGCLLPIAEFGPASLRERWLPGLICGESIGAIADAAREGVQAHRSPKGWRLEGVQPAVVNAPIADLFVVRAGASTFVVERGAPGLEIGPRIASAGLRSATIAELRFAGCELPAEHRLGLLAARGATQRGSSRRDFRRGREAEAPLYLAYCKLRRQSPRRKDQARCRDGLRHGLLGTLVSIQRWRRACQLAAWVGLLGRLVSRCEQVARARGASPSQRARLADMRIALALCERVQARAAWRLTNSGHADALDHDLAVASALLGEQVATSPRAAVREFGEPLGEAGLLERLARDAATLERLIERPERARATIAAALLDQGSKQ